MSTVAVFFADGFEEVEALTVVDLCRRVGIETPMVSVTQDKKVIGSHKITVIADQLLEETDFDFVDMIVLPGGLQGTRGLEACEPLMKQVDAFFEKGKCISAICAAPSIFGHRGLLEGRSACCYPSFEDHLEGANVSSRPVTVSDHVMTSRGMGTAMDFGLAIVEHFCGKEAADKLAGTIVYQ